jgi:hypothetical protein
MIGRQPAARRTKKGTAGAVPFFFRGMRKRSVSPYGALTETRELSPPPAGLTTWTLKFFGMVL